MKVRGGRSIINYNYKESNKNEPESRRDHDLKVGLVRVYENTEGMMGI